MNQYLEFGHTTRDILSRIASAMERANELREIELGLRGRRDDQVRHPSAQYADWPPGTCGGPG
jgi:hypothetical protein